VKKGKDNIPLMINQYFPFFKPFTLPFPIKSPNKWLDTPAEKGNKISFKNLSISSEEKVKIERDKIKGKRAEWVNGFLWPKLLKDLLIIKSTSGNRLPNTEINIKKGKRKEDKNSS